MRFALIAILLLAHPVAAQPDPAVLVAEQERIDTIAKVRPAVLAVCFFGGEACGSGVLIDPTGYALTNFHVVQPTGSVLQCGMPDGKLYDAVLVGQDRVGDVALIKLLPREPGKPFPFAKLGDSDAVRAGDWSLAMGNPFGLSLDFTPTVTYGLVSGVNRYQPPEGRGTLEYTDCIQVEASINPGNSGGPLFNMQGELIGINGRGSFEKRGRVNSGVGYAISINQIKHFLGHLKAGLDCDHASLGATVKTENEDGDLAKMVVEQVLSDSDADRRELEPGDQLVSFAGRPLTSVNQFKNVLGIYPKGWRLPLTTRRNGSAKTALIRLAGTLSENAEPEEKPKNEKPKPKKVGQAESAANKLYEAKSGFANYYFNRQAQASVKAAMLARGDFAPEQGTWILTGSVELADRKGDATITFGDSADGLAQVKLDRGGVVDAVSPLKVGAPIGELQLPQGSNGMLAALYQWRRLLTQWDAGFEGGFDHGGHEPWYTPNDKDPVGPRTDCEILKTQHGTLDGKWYFDLADRRLLGLESSLTREEDPCELTFRDYRAVEGRDLPHTISVRVGDRIYATIRVNSYTFPRKP